MNQNCPPKPIIYPIIVGIAPTKREIRVLDKAIFHFGCPRASCVASLFLSIEITIWNTKATIEIKNAIKSVVVA